MTPAAQRGPLLLDLTPRPDRLAELVWHLSGCSPEVAHDAVRGESPETFDDAVTTVARGLAQVRCRARRVPAAV